MPRGRSLPTPPPQPPSFSSHFRKPLTAAAVTPETRCHSRDSLKKYLNFGTLFHPLPAAHPTKTRPARRNYPPLPLSRTSFRLKTLLQRAPRSPTPHRLALACLPPSAGGLPANHQRLVSDSPPPTTHQRTGTSEKPARGTAYGSRLANFGRLFSARKKVQKPLAPAPFDSPTNQK